MQDLKNVEKREKMCYNGREGRFLVQRPIIIRVEMLMESKKYLILLVLKLLESNTDASSCLTQTEISRIISAKYKCDRKTVSRNIKFLKEIGYPIIKTGKGFYMDRKVFSVQELNFILDAVNNAPDMEGINRNELYEKTKKHLSPMLKRK